MIVNIDEFLEKYASKAYGYGAYIPAHIYNIVLSEASAFAELPDDVISQIESEKARLNARDREYNEISLHRHYGIEYEESGDIEKALDEYRNAVRHGLSSTYDMSHAYRYCQDRINSLSNLFKY